MGDDAARLLVRAGCACVGECPGWGRYLGLMVIMLVGLVEKPVGRVGWKWVESGLKERDRGLEFRWNSVT